MNPSLHQGPWYFRLHWQIALALGAGLVLGFGVGEAAVPWVGWLGTAFIRLLRMVIVPLVITSITSGIASVGSGRSLGRLGAKTLAYYITTSVLAILVGLVLVNVIQPGSHSDLTTAERVEVEQLDTPGSLSEIFMRLIPLNPVAAAASGDMLGLIFFAILMGIALTRLPPRPADMLRGLFDSGFELMMVIAGGVIRLAPLGVLGLITTAGADKGVESFKPLGWYMLTVASGLAIHLFVTLPLLLLLVGRINPRIHFRNMTDALLTAFSTSSSAATLPVTLHDVEKKAGVSNRVTSFVLPMGATINMDGTALYECVAVIFMAQVMGFGLDVQAQFIVVVTALLASIGAAAIPSAGLVVIFIITEAINMRGPEVAILVGTLLAIDRPLDMFRTMVNVFSDSCGAAIIARSEGESDVDRV
ncbi:MAG: dicarboxylate/amino acid:cation symporter [Acidobacteria bacterium]|nr:dicarboxylate/amino acid:cation symporter [Acidobacteriota bacterium]